MKKIIFFAWFLLCFGSEIERGLNFLFDGKKFHKRKKMCENLTNELIAADVFGNRTNVTLNTPLLQYCDDIATVLEQFNTFCLAPASVNVSGSGEICDPTDKADDDFLFNQMAAGDVDEFSQLPVLWQSAPILHGNTSLWVNTGMTVIDDFKLSYSGIQSMVFSDNGGVVLGLTTSGLVGTPQSVACSASNVIISNGDGFTRNAGLPGNAVWHGRAPYLAINPLGTLRVVGDYVWTELSQTWTKMSLGLSFSIEGVKVVVLLNTTYIIWIGHSSSLVSNYIVYKTTNPSTTTLTLHASHQISSLSSGNSVGFLTVTPNQQVAVYSGKTDSQHFIILREIVSDTVLQTIVPTSQSLMSSSISTAWPNYQLTAGCFQNFGSTLTITFTSSAVQKVVSLVINSSGTEIGSAVLSTVAAWLDCDAYNLNAAFVVGGGGVSYMLDGSNDFNIIASPFGIGTVNRFGFLNFNGSHNAIMWTSRQLPTDRKLWSYRTEWNDDAQLYTNLVPVSDLGSATLNTDDWNPGPSWFMGTQLTAVPLNPNLPYRVPSKHFRYRVNLNASSRIAPVYSVTIFVYFSDITLTRSNDYQLLKSAQTIRLFNDGNVMALNSSQQIIWENNMHDGTSNSDTSTIITTSRPGISLNGIYATVFDDVAQSFTMYYYPFNNELFRDYGLTSDSKFNNSLTAQTNFCFDNLQTDPDNENNIKFSDGRCTCIGGQRLFDALFINVDLMPPTQRALLLDSLPCIMVDCSKSRVNFDPTNTFRLLQNKCKVPITICSTSIRAEDQSSIGNIGVIQDCGTNPLPECVNNSECPVGTKCVNNQCKQACLTNEDCTNFGFPGYDCDDGACVNNGGASNGGLSDGEIAAIAVSVVVAITLIAVLCWYFLVFKKANPNP